MTSLSVLVAAADDGAADVQVRAVADWAPPQFRIEFVLVGATPGPLTRRLDDLAWSWVVVESPDGGRGPALDRASAESTGEFVVVSTDGLSDDRTSLDRLSGAFGHMWVNGADALVISGSAEPVGAHPSDPDRSDVRAQRLGTALGLRWGEGGPAVVVLRRWVARFLFDDIGRAIDPIEEFTERVRLLELRLVEVVDGP